MMWILNRLTGHRDLVVTETERAILVRDGRVVDVLGPGKHRIWLRDTVETHALDTTFVENALMDAILRDHPALVARHLTEVRTEANEVAVVELEGRVLRLLGPEMRALWFTDAGPFTVTRLDVAKTAEVPRGLGERLERAVVTRLMATWRVPVGHAGVMVVDGADPAVLTPGVHRYFETGARREVKVIDLRRRTHEVTGHEILTKDRVTLRVNLAADYRVVDPVAAVTLVRDFEDALHRAVGLAFRRTLGALTLDRLLADKVAVDTEAAEAVRTEMAGLGVEVGAIALKDVVLPGEMREILTAVVAAEKEAEANVIRRREETNATRSLLNTAKVMAENPVLLRLKELEALETIAGKVERLTVHNGTEGLMTDLVRLRD